MISTFVWHVFYLWKLLAFVWHILYGRSVLQLAVYTVIWHALYGRLAQIKNKSWNIFELFSLAVFFFHMARVIWHALYGKLVRIISDSENHFILLLLKFDDFLWRSLYGKQLETLQNSTFCLSQNLNHCLTYFSIEPLGNRILLLNVSRGTSRDDIRQSILR